MPQFRKVDNGIAAHMRLYTTMDRTLFLDSCPKLFPGAGQAQFINVGPDATASDGDRLLGVLSPAMQAGKPITLASGGIEASTGIRAKALKRAFNSKRCKPLQRQGWLFLPGDRRKAKPALSYAPTRAQGDAETDVMGVAQASPIGVRNLSPLALHIRCFHSDRAPTRVLENRDEQKDPDARQIRRSVHREYKNVFWTFRENGTWIRARYADGLHKIVPQDRFQLSELVYLS